MKEDGEEEEKSLIIDISGLPLSGPGTSTSSVTSECVARASPGIAANLSGNPPIIAPEPTSSSSSSSSSSSTSSIPSAIGEGEPERVFFMHPKPLSKVQRVLVILSVWFSVLVCFAVLFSIILIVWYLIAKPSILSIAFLAVFLSLIFVPKTVQIWPEYTSNRIFQFWASYFDFSLVSEAKLLRPSQRYIFASFPHGIFPAGVFFSQVLNCKLNLSKDLDERNFYGGKHTLIGVADALTHFPLWRQTFGWAGITSASYGNLVNQLVNRNMNISLLPGGIAEMFIPPVKDTEEIYLNSRKGFIRLALETGSHLVPCYYFGQSHILHQLNIPFLAKISRKIRISLFILVPWVFRHKIVMVMGRPIAVQKKEGPSDEDIQALHAQFKDEMIRIFDSYKHLVSWNQYKLVIQ